MPDNDIERLLEHLDGGISQDHRWAEAVRALVAERNALAEDNASQTDKGNSVRYWHDKACAYKSTIADGFAILDSAGIHADGERTLSNLLTALVADRNALKQRVAVLERDQTPSHADIIQMDLMNRDAELRLTCSALTGIYAHLNRVDDPVRNGQSAAAAAKAALDALRSPRTWRTCDPVRDLCGDPDSDLDGEALVAMRKEGGGA